MGKQVDKCVIYTSFDKSGKEQWLYNIASGNTDYSTLPKKSVLMKIALEFYLNSIGIKYIPNVKKVSEELNNSSKIPGNKVEIIEEPKNIQQETKEESGVVDEEFNILGENL